MDLPNDLKNIIRIHVTKNGEVTRTEHEPIVYNPDSDRLKFSHWSENWYAHSVLPEQIAPPEGSHNALPVKALHTVRQAGKDAWVILTTPEMEEKSRKMIERTYRNKRFKECRWKTPAFLTFPRLVVINPIHTSCRDCIFASYSYDKTGDTKPVQNGCTFGNRLEIYKEQGSVVEVYDEKCEFYLINGRKCHAYRDSEWAKFYEKNERKSKVRDEIKTRIDAVIILDEASGLSRAQILGNLELLLFEITAQSHKFNQIIVVNNRSAVKTSHVVNMLREKSKDIPWKATDVKRVIDGELSEDNAIEEVFSHLKGNFYMVLELGSTIPNNLLQKIDEAINDKLQRFLVGLPIEGRSHGLLVHPGIHKNGLVSTSGDGKQKRLYEAFKAYADETNQSHMYVNMQDFIQ